MEAVMISKDCTTKVEGLASFGYENSNYPVQVFLPSSLPEALAKIGRCGEDEVVIEAPQGAQDAVLGVICAAWEQNAKQGSKEEIRKAIATGEQEAVDEAIAKHQERAPKYVMGAPRGGAVGGVTKTKAGNVGKELLAKLGAEGLKALAQEHGIDPDDLS